MIGRQPIEGEPMMFILNYGGLGKFSYNYNSGFPYHRHIMKNEALVLLIYIKEMNNPY
jgi:hypothetical protein